jgi:hypothetical protein
MKKEIPHVLRVTPAQTGKLALGWFRVAYRATLVTDYPPIFLC